MESSAQLTVWSDLFQRVDSSPSRFPVNDWTFRHPQAGTAAGDMDIWPIIKMAVMLRSCHYFHAGAERVIIPHEQRDLTVNARSDPTQTDSPQPRSRFDDWRQSFIDLPARLRARPDSSAGQKTRSWPNFRSNVLFFGASICNYKIGEYTIQNHLDPIRVAVEDLGFTTATLLSDVNHADPVLDGALFGGTFGFKKEFAEAMSLYGLPEAINFDELDGFSDWYQDILACYPIDQLVTRKIISDAIVRSYSAYLCFESYFSAHSIKAVFTYAYYGILGYAAAMACRESGIPLIDIQHGVTGAGHESYNWPGMPDQAYNVVPTHFLFWSDIERQALNKSTNNRGPEAISIGHSWRLTEALLSSTEASALVDFNRLQNAREAYARLESIRTPDFVTDSKGRSFVVLLTLLPDEPIEWLLPVFAQANDGINFVIRLHPGEVRDPAKLEDRIAQLESERVNVEWASKLPMPVVLRKCSMHLTKYSSSVLDAYAYGVPSVCYSPSARWFYESSQHPFVTVVDANAESVLVEIDKLSTGSSEYIHAPRMMSARQLTSAMADVLNVQRLGSVASADAAFEA